MHRHGQLKVLSQRAVSQPSQGEAMRLNSSAQKSRRQASRSLGVPTPSIRDISTMPASGSAATSLPAFRSSRRRCQKCQGWVVVQTIDLAKNIETRCLNCGWQPQYGPRDVRETDEARAIRQFTGGFWSSTTRNPTVAFLEQAFRNSGPSRPRRSK